MEICVSDSISETGIWRFGGFYGRTFSLHVFLFFSRKIPPLDNSKKYQILWYICSQLCAHSWQHQIICFGEMKIHDYASIKMGHSVEAKLEHKMMFLKFKERTNYCSEFNRQLKLRQWVLWKHKFCSVL